MATLLFLKALPGLFE